ncbi:GNAT family N-acetyltransferase, partial [Acinetobacter baumannii]
GMLAVSPELQAGGLGRRLIAAAEAEAHRRCGAKVMEMTVIHRRPDLIAYYERRGYRQTGEIRPFPYEAPETTGLKMVVLERALA